MTWFSVFLSKGNYQEISLEMLELENKQCHLYTNFSEEHLRWVGTKASALQEGPLFRAHCFSHSILPVGCTMGNIKVEVIYYVGPALGAESVFFEREQTQSRVENTCSKPWHQSSHSSSLGGTWAFSPQHICFSTVVLCKLPLTVSPQNPDQSV